MEKKYFIIIILILFLCTGCNIEYNLTISEDNISEKISIVDTVSYNRSEKDILNIYNRWYPTFVNYITEGETIEIKDYNKKYDGIEYHDKTINAINNGYNYIYTYNYDIDNYYDSYPKVNVYLDSYVYNDNDKLVLRTSEENLLCKYSYFDSLKVNITIDSTVYKLNYTNSLDINNNTYTWVLDRSNCKDSKILLTLEKINSINNISEIYGDKNSSNDKLTTVNKVGKLSALDNYILYIFLFVIVLIIYFGYKWFMEFKEKNNNID